MLRALYNSRAGLTAQQNKMDIVSKNIANASITGYKKLDVAFEDLVNEKMYRKGLPVTAEDKNALLHGAGSKSDTIVSNFNQGVFISTSKDTDLAIDGYGFFRLYGGKDEDGNDQYLFTRDGAFSIDINGNLVNNSGYVLDIDGLTPPHNLKTPITVDEVGNISSEGNVVGKINLYDFYNRDELLSMGNNVFKGNSEIIANSKIRQSYLEASNVEIAKEMTDMIITQRAFQMNSRATQSADEMWKISNNLRSR